MMRYYCTYFDSNYLPRALALYESLRRHCPSFRLWALCMDDAAFASLTALALPGLTPIALADFERGDDALIAAKANRSRVEYYFTCTPSLPLYVLAHAPEVDIITYLDADLYFFGSPEPIYREIAEAPIAIIPHNFPPPLRKYEVNGLYNVGWLSFRRDEQGIACLEWWRERCLEWCYDRVERDRYADQKYLDQWPHRFPGTAVLRHGGANVAPWNLSDRTVWRDGADVRVGGAPLIFYHMQGFKQPSRTLYRTHLANYHVCATRGVMEHIYAPYARALAALARRSVGGNEARLESIKPGQAASLQLLAVLYRDMLAHDCFFLRSGRLMWLDSRWRFVDLGPPSD